MNPAEEEAMDDFTQIMKMLESARQLADMNQLPLLVYLIEVAKAEARSNRFELREKKRGQAIVKGAAG